MTEEEFGILISRIGDMYGIIKHSPTTDKEYGYE